MYSLIEQLFFCRCFNNSGLFLTLRGGVKLAEESLNTDFRMGFGLEFQSFMLDYSYTPSDKLNGTHNFNLSFAIGDFSNQKAAYDYYMQNHFREAAELYHRKDYIAARQKLTKYSVYPEHSLRSVIYKG